MYTYTRVSMETIYGRLFTRARSFFVSELSISLCISCPVLQAAAIADEKVRLREQQQSLAMRQLQKQPRQQQPYLHKHPPPSQSVSNGRNTFLHVPQHQPQQPLVYHHGYPANFATTVPSPVPSSTSPVRSHSPTLSPVAPSYTHHHLTGAFTLPANLSLHGSRQHQVTAMGQDLSRQDFYHTSTGGSGLAQTYNAATSATMATQPRGWSTEPTMVPGPQPILGWNSQSQPCSQPLLTCRGQDET